MPPAEAVLSTTSATLKGPVCPMSVVAPRPEFHPMPVLPLMLGPNITGEFHALDNIATGAFYIPDDWRGWVGSSGVNTHKVDIDASRSSGIYGDSETVQPKAVYLLPCIKF